MLIFFDVGILFLGLYFGVVILNLEWFLFKDVYCSISYNGKE